MRSYIESDIYTALNANNIVSQRIQKLLSGNDIGSRVINKDLKNSLEILKRTYKDPTTLKIIDMINSYTMILFTTSVENSLPTCLPFFKYKLNGKQVVGVDMTAYVNMSRNADGSIGEVSVDTRKLHALTLAAYIDYKVGEDDGVVTSVALTDSAIIWSKLFNKILENAIGLNTNKERYFAFMYFGIKFFLTYYMQAPQPIIEDISKQYISKFYKLNNRLIEVMESEIERKQLNPYSSFKSFCLFLFDASITGLKGASSKMTITFYQHKFVDLYYYPALLSLASFPYLIFTVICAHDAVNICNYKIIKSFTDEKGIGDQLLRELLK